MFIIYGILLLIFLLVLHQLHQSHKKSQYFKKHGIVNLGNTYTDLLQMAFSKKTMLGNLHSQHMRMRAANADFGGISGLGPGTLVITDPGILKNVLVKDFDHFIDRRGLFKKSETFMSNALVFVTGSPWKTLRSKLSPTFTTGKIKRLFPLFDQSAKKLVKYIREKGKSGEMNLNTGYSKLAMDVIASAVCGIDSQTFNQEEPSLFEQMGKKFQINFSVKVIFRFILSTQFPKLAEMFGVTLFGKSTEDFFSRVIKANIDSRVKTGVGREDFLQLMLEAREGKIKLEESELNAFERDALIKGDDNGGASNSNKEILSDDVVAANCVLFILAGYDATQSLLLYSTYALALNPHIQDKLREEVHSIIKDGEFTYDGLLKMKYLDMILSETLRMYPPAIFTDRDCTKDYKFPGTDIIIRKGQTVTIPIYEIHHDERYYPEPETFNPERFSPDRKTEINPYTYLAFGQGPRNCIGMRFALSEVKLVIAHLIHNFNIEPSSKTPIPMEFENSSNLKPKGGMYLTFKPII